jgi:hypothetical protein
MQSKLPFICCKSPLSLQRIPRFVLPADQLKKYRDLILDFENFGVLYCGNPRCSEYLTLALETDSQLVYCIECGENTCRECSRVHKSHMSCDLSVVKLAKEVGWKRCPHCRMMVERSSGCRYMTCRCGQAWCYDCGEVRSPELPCCGCYREQWDG